MIDKRGFRLGTAIVLLNSNNRVFWARRIGNNGWQFPQGGLQKGEKPIDGMYRELYEEIGVAKEAVEVLAESERWMYYYLPRHLVRRYSYPVCIGQKQKWFLLRLNEDDYVFDFTHTESPEFDDYRWIGYWHPLKQVIFFKRKLYKHVLREFEPNVFHQPDNLDGDSR